MWEVGVFADGEVVCFGPFSKTTAEALFKVLQEGASQPFIRLREYKRPKFLSAGPWEEQQIPGTEGDVAS